MLRIIICLLAISSFPSQAFCQGLLQRERYAATRSPSDRPPSVSGSSFANWWNGLGDDGNGPGLDDAIGMVIVAGVTATSPFWLPYVLFDEGYDMPGMFPPYPYARPEAGAIAVGRRYGDKVEGEAPYDSPTNLKPWSLRVSLDEGNSFAGLNRLGGEVFLDTEERLGVLLRGNWFFENLGNGRTDSTMLNDYNVTYRVAQNNWLEMYAGMGLREQLDRYDLFGFNFIYRADFYPCRPLHIDATFAVGNLDRALVLEGHLAVGAVYKHCECLAGYNILQIGNATLQGPFLGLRLWF